MLRIVLILFVMILLFTACGAKEPQPVVPVRSDPPGKLIGIHYRTSSGMVARADFRIRVNPEEIEYTEFWPADISADLTERTHVPITEAQWADLETVVLALHRADALTEVRPESDKQPGVPEYTMLDGGDETDFSLIWDVDGEQQEIGYLWPSDRRCLTLRALLEELADPQGREIVWYEDPQIWQIYFTRKHRADSKKDFSFQFYWATYDEEDPHWELIYYLGKHGSEASGRIRLEDADWNAFLALAEETLLEYFPEPKKNSEWFDCKLNYTDDRYKHLDINKETEARLKEFFLQLIEQHKET